MKKIAFIVILAGLFYFLGYSQGIQRKAVVAAMDEIVLQTGSASIVMKKNGSIVINGSDVSIQSTGKINVKATGELSMKGSKVADN